MIPLLSILAGRLKADRRRSVADAWIAALAKERDATVVHKDPEAGSCAVGEAGKVLRRSHAHQPGDLVEVRIETGDIWEVEHPGFQSQQRIMEIQAALMLAYQFQDRREETWYVRAAPAWWMKAAELLKACEGIRPFIEALTFGEPTAEHRDGLISDAIEENNFPAFLLKSRPKFDGRLPEGVPFIETRYHHAGINNDLGHSGSPPKGAQSPPGRVPPAKRCRRPA